MKLSKEFEYYIKKGMIILLFLLIISSVSASQTNSSNYGMDVDISSGGSNISSSNYKTDVISGTITGNASSSSYKQIFGFFSCVPYTCAGLGYSCGSWSDGCGGTLNCGSCASGYTCSSGTCVAEAVPSVGAGGAAGAGVITGPNFILNKDLIKVLIKQGESKREIIEIKNTGTTSLNISLELENIEKFMVISEKTFSLSLRESKSIFIDIFAKEEEIPDAYTGRIIIKGDGLTKIINVIIEVKERKPLFDVIVQVLSKEVLAGRDVKAKLKVFNLGDLRNIDVKIYYSIQDFDGKILSFKEETIAINEELKVTRTLRVPKGTPLGDYVFYFKASYLNISASSTETFEVVEQETPPLFLILLIFGIILMIVILIFMFIIFKRFLNHINKKREIIKEIKPQEKVKIEEPEKKKSKIQEKKEKEFRRIRLTGPKIKREIKKIKEKRKPKNKVKRITNKFVKEEKRILKKEKKIKRKLLKKIKKGIKKKKRKQRISDLKRLIEKKKKDLEYRRKVRKEVRKSKRKKSPYNRLERVRRKKYRDLLEKIIAMKKKKKNLQEYPPHLHSRIERTREEIRERGI